MIHELLMFLAGLDLGIFTGIVSVYAYANLVKEA